MLKSATTFAILTGMVILLGGCGGAGNSSAPVDYVVGSLEVYNNEGFTGTTGSFSVNNGTSASSSVGSTFTLTLGNRTFEVGVPTTKPVLGQRFPVTSKAPVQGVWATLSEGTPAKTWTTFGGLVDLEENVDGDLVVNVRTMVFGSPVGSSDGSGGAAGTVTVPALTPLKSTSNPTTGLIFKSSATSSAMPLELGVSSGTINFITGGLEYRCNLAGGARLVITDSSSSSASAFDLSSPGYKCEYFAAGASIPIVATAGRGFLVSANSKQTVTLVGVVFGSGEIEGSLDGWFNYVFP